MFDPICGNIKLAAVYAVSEINWLFFFFYYSFQVQMVRSICNNATLYIKKKMVNKSEN